MRQRGVLLGSILFLLLALGLVAALISLLSPFTVNPAFINTNNTNNTINFTLTSAGPQNITSFNLTSPSTNIVFNNISINDTRFLCEVNSTFANCSVTAGQLNLSANQSVIVTINLTATAVGNYTFNFSVVENSSIANYSDKYILLVDFVPPNIALNFPINGLNTTNTTQGINFTWTIIEEWTTTSCNLTINGSTNTSFNNANVTNNTEFSKNFTTLTNNGNYTWNVTCIDLATNSNTSAARSFTIDNLGPATAFDRPPAAGNVSGAYNVNGTVIDATIGVNTSDVRLHIFNGTGTQETISTTVSGTRWNATWNTTAFAEGFYNLTINASDLLGNRNDSISQLDIAVDRTAPNIVLNSPANGFNSTNLSQAFNFTTTDNLAVGLSCNLTINGSTNTTFNNLNVTSGSAKNQQITGLNNGNHTWNVTCSDGVGNLNTSAARSFTIDNLGPATAFTNPAASQNVSGHVNISGTVSDASIGVNTSDVRVHIFNGTGYQQTLTATVSGTNWNATWNTTSGFVDGFYNLTVNASDILLNRNDSVTQLNVKVDNLLPGVLNATAANITDGEADINFNVTEMANGTVYFGTSSNTFSNSIPFATFATGPRSVRVSPNFSNTLFYYNISVCDSANNCNSSVYNFTTLPSSQATSGGGTSAGGGSGGSSSVSPSTSAPTSSAQTTSYIWDSLTTGQTGLWTVKSSTVDVASIQFDAVRTLSGPQLQIAALTGLPKGTTEFDGVYTQYIQINMFKFTDADISNAKVNFKVLLSWLSTKGFQATDIMLFRYDTKAKKWNELPTKNTKSDAKYAYYEANTGGFSLFAIGTRKAPGITASVAVPAKETSTAASTPATTPAAATTTKSSKRGVLTFVVAVIAVLAVIAILFRLGNRSHYSLRRR